MARIFRHSYTTLSSEGRREQRLTKKWYIEYRDEFGKTCRVAGFRDKIATQHKAADLERAVTAALRGGRVSAAIDARTAPVADLVEAYVRHLEAKGDSAKHVKKQRMRLLAIAGELTAIGELTAGYVETWLADGRAAGRFGPSTSNHYRQAACGFTRWLVRAGWLAGDPLGLVARMPATVKGRERRALSADDFGRLVAAAAAGPGRGGVSGSDRAMLYLLAAYTGFRRSELLSLGPESFDLAAGTVRLKAERSKRGREEVAPVPGWLVEKLNVWLVGRSAPLWPAGLRTAAIVAEDLKAAGIDVVDFQGRVFDFHALRVQFVTELARAGVSLVAAQKLARHSTPALTANVYAKLGDEELAKAVERIPAPAEWKTE